MTTGGGTGVGQPVEGQAAGAFGASGGAVRGKPDGDTAAHGASGAHAPWARGAYRAIFR